MYRHGATIANSIIMPTTEDMVRNVVTSVYSDCPRLVANVSAVLWEVVSMDTYPSYLLAGAFETLMACASALYNSTFFSNVRRNKR